MTPKNGFSTGTAAAAAAIAKLLEILTGTPPETVTVLMPDESCLSLPVTVKNGHTGIIKDAGDDPDATNGIFIYIHLELTHDSQIIIEGGNGVGRATRPGLQIKPGEAAINPVPRKMIKENLKRYLPGGKGAKVIINAENGREIAQKTFNSRLGIEGGISILGTSGIVRPMNHEALIKTIQCEIDVLRAENADLIWLVPGKTGEKALTADLPQVKSVQMSNFAGNALTYLSAKGYKQAGLAGHPGKLAKIAMGAYNTHSALFPQANGFVSEVLQLNKTLNTLEEICIPEFRQALDQLASLISAEVQLRYGFDKIYVRLYSMKGCLVGKYE